MVCGRPRCRRHRDWLGPRWRCPERVASQERDQSRLGVSVRPVRRREVRTARCPSAADRSAPSRRATTRTAPGRAPAACPVAVARSQVCWNTSAVKNREIAWSSGTPPKFALVGTSAAETGSSSSEITPPAKTCHAPAGSVCAEGPDGSDTSRSCTRAGNHSIRCPTTSRAFHPATGWGHPTDRSGPCPRSRRSGHRSHRTPQLAS